MELCMLRLPVKKIELSLPLTMLVLQGGDWHYISFNDGSTGSLKYVTIEYAGTQSNYAGVSISTAALINLQFTNLRSRYPTPYRQQFR